MDVYLRSLENSFYFSFFNCNSRLITASLGILSYLWLMIFSPQVYAFPENPSVAFFYGTNASISQLSQFDWVVLEPAHMKPESVQRLHDSGTLVFAYLSMGELSSNLADTHKLPKQIFFAQNKAWQSRVVDLTQVAWLNFIEQQVDSLWQKGYRGFFLDTLDSYQLGAQNPEQIKQQQKALIHLIEHIHQRHPQAKLLLNRGFEILDAVHEDVAGVAAESLFQGWDPGNKTYREVPAADREWLTLKLREVQKKYHLPAIVIDYVPPHDKDLAKKTARQIQQAGFIPWVTDAHLETLGIGQIEVLPREVLIVDDNENDEDIVESDAYQAATILEYLGYVPVFVKVGDLPQEDLKTRYAGIVTWLHQPQDDADSWRQWLLKQLDDRIPIVLLGDLGFEPDTDFLKRINIDSMVNIDGPSWQPTHHDSWVGFEGLPNQALPNTNGFVINDPRIQTHLTLHDSSGHTAAVVGTADWGGFALFPWAIQVAVDEGQSRWVIDPFKFFSQALHLPDMPVPDATTENGSRLLTIHIDGDGFPSRAELPGTPYAGEVLLKQVLSKYQLPTTFSVIQGEIDHPGLAATQAKQLQDIARQIFRLPNVEIASHTYSHPFSWQRLYQGMPAGTGKFNLPIPGYRYDPDQEIKGSLDWINRKLAPPDKKAKVLLWSGDAVPRQEDVERAAQAGVVNVNGGNTSIDKAHFSLTQISPMSRPLGPYRQIFAPVTNENVYTNGWHGPYWGYENAIQSFQMLDMPRRLRPISIYYHCFSATKPASLEALRRTYAYALSQPNLPLYLSEYAHLVEQFYEVAVGRDLNGNWVISNTGQIRTLRLPKTLGWPDLGASKGVAGVIDLPQGRYIALTGAPKSYLVLRSQPPDLPYLARSNGRIVYWRAQSQEIQFQIQGHVPVRVALAGLKAGCLVKTTAGLYHPDKSESLKINFNGKDTGNVLIQCP